MFQTILNKNIRTIKFIQIVLVRLSETEIHDRDTMTKIIISLITVNTDSNSGPLASKLDSLINRILHQVNVASDLYLLRQNGRERDKVLHF